MSETQDRIQLEPTWKARLKPEFEKDYMRSLREFLNREKLAKKVIFPRGAEFFAALNHTPFDKVKVVILGQDPYHGPGQVVGYPILDLGRRGRDVDRYLRALEDVLIGVAARFGVTARRQRGFTGVWVGNAKLAAIGVGIRRWVTMHGFALNVADLRAEFAAIVPCGLAGRAVTSLAELTGTHPAMADVEAIVVDEFLRIFGTADAGGEAHP